jgi:hypothetical protein
LDAVFHVADRLSVVAKEFESGFKAEVESANSGEKRDIADNRSFRGFGRYTHTPIALLP